MTTKRKTATKRKEPEDIKVARRAAALQAFSVSPHFKEVMACLKENALFIFNEALGEWEALNPFVEADWNPVKAAGFDCRQGLVRVFEREIRKAKRWTKKTNK